MPLSKEQIRAAREKYGLSGATTTPGQIKDPTQRIAELRNTSVKNKEVVALREEEAKQPKKKGFLAGLTSSTGLADLYASGKRAAETTLGLGKMGAEFLTGQSEKAKETFWRTSDAATKPISMGAFGTYKPATTPREVLGAGLKAGTTLGFLGAGSVAGTTGKAIGTRIGAGAAAGGLTSGGEAISEDKGVGDIAKETAMGALTGAAVAGAFEGIGYAFRKFNFTRNIGKNTYNKELQPPKKELVKSIENDWKTFGESVRNQVDDAGAPVYKGTYKTMKLQAKNELKNVGGKVDDLARQFDDAGVKVNRNEIVGDIFEEMQDTFGRLTNTQKKNINFEIGRMNLDGNNVTDMIKYKRMYDKLIPDSYWLKAGDANTAMTSQVKYSLRDRLRQTINEKTKDQTMAALNQKMSIAMDVKHLTSEQLAKRISQKVSGEGGFYHKMIGRFIDDYIFNPAFTTRASQAALGQQVGATGLRKGTRLGATRVIEENRE